MRTTLFAPAIAEASERTAGAFGYAPAEAGLPWKVERLSGRDAGPSS